MQTATASPPNNRATGTEGNLAWTSPQPIALQSAAMGEQAFLGESQREAADVLQRALAERHVFAALTGAPGLGKTLVLSTAIAARLEPPPHIIRIDRPDQVSAEQAAEIERLVLGRAQSAGCPHTVLVVDNAHTAPPGLLRCLTRVAANSRLNPGSSQVILAGRPELWDRLKAKEFVPLVERIALRPVLRPMTDEDMRGLIRHLLDQPRRIFGQALADGAEQELLRLAAGRPEQIGAIIRSTITLGDVQTRPPISSKMVRNAAIMLDGVRRGQEGKRRATVIKPALVVAAVMAMAVGFALAAPNWPLDRILPSALNFAGDVLSWRAPSAGHVPPTLAQLARRVPADRSNGDNPPVAVADAPRAKIAQAAPPTATQNDADHSTAEDHPSLQPVPPESALPQMQDQSITTAPTPSEAADPAPGADRAQDAAEASEPSPTAAAPAAPSVVASPRPATGTAAPPLAPAMVMALLRRGDEALALGDISTARRFYERTIVAGSALGARGIARTYDPAVLGRGNPAANPAATAAWYNMATALDDVEADARRTATKGEHRVARPAGEEQ